MMDAEERRQFEELRSRVACDKRFCCVNASLDDLCKTEYHADIDILECLEGRSTSCKFARPFGCTAVCCCPVRKFIAQHFDKWSAESTAVLRVGTAHPK